MTAEPPLICGIDAAIIGVSDPGPHLALYCDQLGFAVAGGGRFAAGPLWGSGSGEIAYTVLAAAGAPSGRILLLTVPGADPAAARHPHTSDLGLAGIDLYTKDITATHATLNAAGHPWLAPPATFEIPFGGSVVTVTEGFCLAPDGTDLVFVQPASPRGTGAWDADHDRAYTEVTSVVCHVGAFEAEVAFWGPEGLGLALWYDVTFRSAGLEAMAGLPENTDMRLAFLAGERTARIEVISLAAVGTDNRPGQRPGHAFGHTGWVVSTTDLDEALHRAAARGGVLRAGPMPVPGGPFGSGRVAALDTPNGIAVTIVEAAHGAAAVGVPSTNTAEQDVSS